MKQTKNFNIVVPELGDKPDITQVSDAIQSLEDALAGTLEVMNATLNGTALTLVSGARTTKRTKYYDGMSIRFIAPSQIAQNTLTSVKVDDLSVQTLQVPYLVNSGDSVDIVYKTNKFVGVISAVQRSNDINSTSTTTVATSNAVKQLNDNKAEKSIQIIAGNGLTGGGNLTSNKTINIVSEDEGIIVNSDNIKLNTINAVNNTNAIRPASANAAKTAYDKGVEALAKGNEALAKGNEALTHSQNVNNAKVSKSGDLMTGALGIQTSTPYKLALKANLLTEPNYILGQNPDGSSSYYFGKGGSGYDITIHAYQHNTTLNLLNDKVRSNKDLFVNGDKVYHQGFKPTSLDVGLGNVNNWVATTAINDPSTTKYATASAVKNANDNANGRVSKSGDTMTGILTSNSLNSEAFRHKYTSKDYYSYFGSNPNTMAGFFGIRDSVDTKKDYYLQITPSNVAFVKEGSSNPLYHTGNKPTKADVGLGNVNNWAATSSVSDPSNSTYATAGAVKTAYDKGESALQNAITAQNSANARVAKSGDTMTGTLEIQSNDGPKIKLRQAASNIPNYILGQKPDGSSSFYIGKGSSDSDDIRIHSYTHNNTLSLLSACTQVSKDFEARGIIRAYDYGGGGRNRASLTMDKPGAGSFGIGQMGSDQHIRYGNVTSISDPSWTGSSSFTHWFDGTVKASNNDCFIHSSYGRTGIYISSLYVGFQKEGAEWLFYSDRSGNCIAAGNLTAYSDIKLKKDLEIIPNAIDKIQALNGYTYTRKDTGERQTGVVAQEVQKVLPEAVQVTKAKEEDKDQSDTLTVAYGNMVGLLIEGIKEQQRQIEELNKKIEKLEGR